MRLGSYLLKIWYNPSHRLAFSILTYIYIPKMYIVHSKPIDLGIEDWKNLHGLIHKHWASFFSISIYNCSGVSHRFDIYFSCTDSSEIFLRSRPISMLRNTVAENLYFVVARTLPIIWITYVFVDMAYTMYCM